MADISRTVEIDVKVVGDAAKTLEGLNTLLGGLKGVVDGLAANIGTVASGVDNFARALNPLSTFKVDNIQNLDAIVSNLSKTDFSKITGLGTSLKSISDFKAPAGFTAFTNSLVQLGGISKFPPLTGVGDFMVKAGSVEKFPSLGPFVKNLQALSAIDKFPALGALGTSLTALSSITHLPALGTFVTGLKGLAGVEKLPSLKAFAAGLKDLTGVGTLPVIPEGLGKGIAEFSKIGKLPSLKGFATGLKELSGIANLPVIPEGLGKSIKGFEGIGKLPAMKAFATGLKQLSGIANLPVIPEGLGKSIKSFEGIGKLPALKSFATGLKELGKIGHLPTIPAELVTSIQGFARIKAGDLPKLGPFSKGLQGLLNLKFRNIDKLANVKTILAEFSKIEKVPNITKLNNSLQKLADIKLPDFSALISGIKKLAKAFESISKSEPLIAALSKIGSGAAKVEKDLDKLTKSTKKTTNGFAELGKRLKNYVMYRIIADSVIAIKEAFTGSIEAMVEYDQSLKNLQAIMQTTDAEARAMGVAIEGVASSTKFSATEVAEGMQILGQSGLSATEAINTIQATADLATGTLTDMATSVDLITTALRVFDIATEDSAHIADVFANAVNGSKLTIDKLRTAMNYVGPIAASAGVSLEETAASMMTLANSGQRASTIGTGLRRMFAELIDPSEKMKKAAEKVGISLEQLDPTANNLSDVIRDLGVVITDADVAFDLFGKRGAAAALSLTKDVSGGFDSMLQSVGRFGTASAMAEKQMEGLGVSFKNLQDKIKLVAIALGKAGMISALKVLVDMLRDLADGTVWLIDNALKPLMGILKPLTSLFSAMPSGIQAVSIAFLALALNVGGVTAAFGKMASIGVVSKLTSAATAAWTLNTATAASTASLSAFSAATIASAGSTSLFAGALAALKAAMLAVMGPIGWILAGVTAVVAAYAIWHKSNEELIEDFETTRIEIGQTSQVLTTFRDQLAKMEASDVNIFSLKGKEEMLDYMEKLTEKFPELTKEIYATGGSLEEINEILEAHQKALDLKLYEKAKEGLKGYVGSLGTVAAELDKLETKEKAYGESNELARGIADKKAEVKILVSDISQIILDAKKNGETIDVHDLIETAGIRQTEEEIGHLAWMVESQVEVMQQAIDGSNFSGKFQLYGIASQWKKEFDATDNELSEFGSKLENFLSDNYESNARFDAMLVGIDKKKIAGYITRQRQLVVEMEKADKELTGEARLEAMRSVAERGVQLNAEIARDEDAQRVIGHANLVKWNNKEIAEIEKSNQSKAAKDADRLQQLKEANQKRDKIMATGVDAGDALDQYKNYAKEELNAFKIQQTKLTAAIAKGGKDRAKLESDKSNNATEFYNKQYIAAQIMYEKSSKSSNEDIQKAMDELGKAKLKAEEAQTAAVKTHTDLRIAEQKREYTRRKEEIETGSAAMLAAVEAEEAAGLLTYEEAEKAKVQITLDRYKRIAQLAKENRDEPGISVEEYAKRNVALLNAQEQYYNKKNGFAEAHNNKVNQLDKQLIASDKKVTKEKAKHLSNQKKATDKHVKKISKIWREYTDDREDAASDLADKIFDIEHDLEKKLEDIEEDLDEVRKDYAEDRLEREKKLKADLEGIEQDTLDSLDKVRQKDMSDKQKARDNEKIAERKLSEAKKLRAEGERTGNAELIKQSDDLLDSAQSLAEGYKSASKAKRMINDVGDAKKANAVTEKEIKDLEAIKKLNEEIAKAGKEKTDATEASEHKVQLAEREHEQKMGILAREREQAISDADAAHLVVMANELERHGIKMANLADEAAELKKQQDLSKQIAQDVSKDSIGSAPSTPISPSSKPTGNSGASVLTQEYDAAFSEIEQQSAATAKKVAGQLKAIGENGTKGMDEFVVATTDSGQKVITTVRAMQSGFSAFGQYVSAEPLSAVNALGNAINLVNQSPIDIKADDTMNRLKGHIDNLQEQMSSVGDQGNGLKIVGPEQEAQIQALADQMSSLFSGLSTDDPKQKLQDMMTTLQGMGSISQREFDTMAGQITAYAETVDGVSVNLEYAFDGYNSKLTENSGLIDENGNKLEGLSQTLQSNPYEIFEPDTFSTITAGIENVEGSLDHLKERATEEAAVAINTATAEEALVDLKQKYEENLAVIEAEEIALAALDTSAFDQSLTEEEQAYQDMVEGFMEPIELPAPEPAPDTEEVLTQPVEEAKDKIEADPITPVIKPDTAEWDSGVGEIITGIKELEGEEVIVSAKVEAAEGGSFLDKIGDIITKAAEINSTEANLTVTTTREEFDKLITELQELMAQENTVQVAVQVTGTDDMNTLETWLQKIDDNNPKNVDVTANVTGNDKVILLKQSIDGLINKTIVILADTTSAIASVRDLMNICAELVSKYHNKIIKLTVETTYKENGNPPATKAASGGFIDKFAAGGGVFKKLASPFISRGGGHKDDVPAMLMKGEFVQKVSAVQKYGRNFMNMVNQGSFPIELAKKGVPRFAAGGGVGFDFNSSSVVQNFAKGGSVLSGLLGSMRKRLFDLFGTEVGNDVNLNVDSVNFQSVVSDNSKDIRSELGADSVGKLAEAFTSSVQGFASGGPIVSMSYVDDASNKIKMVYDDMISASNQSGDYERAAILEKERQALMVISDELKAKVLALTEDYEADVSDAEEDHTDSVTDTTESYNESVDDRDESNADTLADIQESYDDSVGDEKESYNDQVADDSEDYSDTELDYNSDSSENLDEYDEEKDAIDDEYKNAYHSLWGDLIDARSGAREAAEEINDSGRILGASGNYRDTYNTYPYEGYDIPDWNTYKRAVESYWFTQDVDYSTMMEQKEKALEKGAKLWSSWLKSVASLEDLGIDNTTGVVAGTQDLSTLALTLSEANKQEELDLAQEGYDEKQTEYNADWNDYKVDHNESVTERDTDHAESLADYLESYNEGNADENESYAEDMADYLESYTDSIGNADESLADALESLLDSYEGSIKSESENSENETEVRRKETESDLSDLANKRATIDVDEIGAPLLGVMSEEESNNKRTMSIEELLKKLSKNIFGFNTGGSVPHTSFSVPGKDSIMAALTPGEFVMKDSVVSHFGAGFFESLNNFKVPGFNLGGVVGTIANSVQQVENVKHSLELTVNGTTHEELMGSAGGIDAILNDLALAKMRS